MKIRLWCYTYLLTLLPLFSSKPHWCFFILRLDQVAVEHRQFSFILRWSSASGLTWCMWFHYKMSLETQIVILLSLNPARGRPLSVSTSIGPAATQSFLPPPAFRAPDTHTIRPYTNFTDERENKNHKKQTSHKSERLSWCHTLSPDIIVTQ